MGKSILLIGASLLAAPVLAQEASPPNAAGAPTPAGDAAAPSAAQAAPSGGAAAAQGATAQAVAADVTAGAAVSDTSGGAVGRIASVANGNATVDTGTVKAAIPIASFAKGQNGLVLGMTKAELEAAAAKASKPAEVAVGAQVVGPQGDAVGKVAAVNGDLVTVETPKSKVQLPRNAFAQNGGGALAIGMTLEQLEAAAQSAKKPS